jgi:hypothetical protein
MKKKVLALALILVMALTVGLVACNSGSNATDSLYLASDYSKLVSSLIGKNKAGTYTAYAPVHTVYLGKADITIDNKGKITKLVLDEYFFPHAYATTTSGDVDTTVVPADNHGAETTATLAKKFTLDGRTFELTVPASYSALAKITNLSGNQSAYYVYKQISGEAIPGTVAGTTKFTNDLAKLVVGNQQAAAWYVNAIGDGTGLKLLKADGTTASGVTAANYSSGVHKLEGKYWGAVSGTQVYTWQGNMNLIQDFAVANQLPDASFSQIGGSWFYVGMINTGATASDFNDYYKLAQMAYIVALQAK